MLLCALALVPALALSARRALGARAACLFAWLLAVSPLLVLYGRILRSYGPVLLLAPLAVLAFHRWLEGGRRRDAALYACAAPLAAYFHLVSSALVAAPLAYGFLTLRRRARGAGAARPRGRDGARGRRALRAGGREPARLRAREERRGEPGLVGGVDRGPAPVGPALALARGAVLGRLRARARATGAAAAPALAAYLAFVCVAHLAAVPVASPAKLANKLVFERYVLPLPRCSARSMPRAAELMRRFYANLREDEREDRVEKLTALRRAQLSMLTDARRAGDLSGAPASWAGFVLSGDPR